MSHATNAVMSEGSARALARGLGWFSLALGLTELLAPRQLAGALGMKGQEGLVQAYGVREIASGLGILGSDSPAPWVWSRVAGDGLDIATLLGSIGESNPKRDNVAIALASVAGVTLLDLACAQALSAGNSPMPRAAIASFYRSGFPSTPDVMRGAAGDFVAPRDFRAPEALRPFA